MTIAVTAASGKLGSETVRALSAIGTYEVVGLARTPSNASHLGVEVRPGDYDEPAALEQSLAGVDAVLLVSGMAEPNKRIEQHRNVIRAAAKAGVQRIVYTSVEGPEGATGFSPIVQSNRQTEADVRESGMDWVIGRNGIYIEPDVEYIDTYREMGRITNCAGPGKCGYTTRPELAQAYGQMLTGDSHIGKTYNLHGERLTQAELARHLNSAFGTALSYTEMTVEEYRRDRVAELGEFIGGVIAGIYEGIRLGAFDSESDYAQAAGRAHQDWDDYFEQLAQS
ncbi:MAG: SDR family oxidoreductase [Rhodothermales bacterium]|nr:SDR family oxidoreductase [Rhodothermales bacterium]